MLQDVTLAVGSGEFCAIVGPSGSGKSTLLNVIGLLDQASSGSLSIDGLPATGCSAHESARLRNRLIGFVFQSFHLLPRLTAWQNVALPLQYRGVQRADQRAAAEAMLARVGLSDRSDHFPGQLSGGQSQRVAIARALVGSPRLLLADEPTGSLDSGTARDIMALLASLNDMLSVTILMVTHDRDLAAACSRRIAMRDGRVLDGSSGTEA
ncbi:ABC transporter ATP-binding protein [Sphingomonas sp. DT-207]|uniref:ABC transporter ATP-binding protein n=1 Tax=Sphingomonas sp. DT-207 TaxID=3396167 RepID=UPI003F541366